MAQSERRQALSDLRSYLQKDVKDVNATITTEFYKHPTQMDISSVVKAYFSNERIIRRNKCITAEYNKLVREEPYDDSSLSSSVNSFFRNFETKEHNFPVTYNVSASAGISATISLVNKGVHYNWDEKDNVYLKLTLKPDAGALIPAGEIDANFRQWFFKYKSGSDNTFNINLSHDELDSLSRRNYYAVFEMYEGEVIGGEESDNGFKNVDGEMAENSLKFNGKYVVNFTIIDNMS